MHVYYVLDQTDLPPLCNLTPTQIKVPDTHGRPCPPSFISQVTPMSMYLIGLKEYVWFSAF